jgi:3-carboxy-cis,cis-muconate cycloisomerase
VGYQARAARHDERVDHSQLFGALFDRGRLRIDDDAWLQAMLDTEAGLARAAERAGLAPSGSGTAVTSVASVSFFDNGAIGAAAAATGNPVPALVKALTGLLPAESAAAAPAIHLGATSQDIIDTAAMLIARRVLAEILADLSAAASACAGLTREHAVTVMAGRTLLQQAVPITFGLVTAGWLTAIDEARQQLHYVRTHRLAIQYGGAAGTLATLGDDGPRVAGYLAEELGLALPVLPWHTNRSRILDLAAALTQTCAALGKVARDVTLLAQTEVQELAEGGTPGTGGSSTMPHKQNPVASTLTLANARQAPNLYATLATAAEQELQRAAGSWHAEWLPLTALLNRTTAATAWATTLLQGLQVNPVKMRQNLDLTHGLLMAENLATQLAPLLGRLTAHDLIEQASRRATASSTDLVTALYEDNDSAAKLAETSVSRDQLAASLTPATYLGATQQFIDRALQAHQAVDSKLA